MPLGNPPLNRVPKGILDYFGIKNGGRYPEHLVPQLQPVLELGSWYMEYDTFNTQLILAASPFTASVSAGNNAGFSADTFNSLPISGGQISVPVGEIWWVPYFGVSWICSSNAGNFASLRPIVQIPQVGTMDLDVITNGEKQGIAANSRGGEAHIQRPLFLYPGWAPRYYVNALDCPGGGATVAVSASIRVLRILI